MSVLPMPAETACTSSMLEITFRLGEPGAPYPNMEEVVAEMDYYVAHDAISGFEITREDADTGQLVVAVTLHQEVGEEGAQEIASDLDYAFINADTALRMESEMLDVEFPAFVG